MIIETLAIEPNNGEQCMGRITKVCDLFAESEDGKKLLEEVGDVLNTAKESENLKKRNKVMFLAQVRFIKVFDIDIYSIILQFYALLQRSCIDNWRNPALASLLFICGYFNIILFFRYVQRSC
jgi:hypothetical protein